MLLLPQPSSSQAGVRDLYWSVRDIKSEEIHGRGQGIRELCLEAIGLDSAVSESESFRWLRVKQLLSRTCTMTFKGLQEGLC